MLERLLGECFGTKPAVVYLEPFDDEEQKQFFDAAFPGEDFASFVKETEPFELHPLLGNPEFLQLFGEAYVQSGGRPFTSKRQSLSAWTRDQPCDGFQSAGGMTLTIHGIPNLSIREPKPGDQKVSPKGMTALPPSDS